MRIINNQSSIIDALVGAVAGLCLLGGCATAVSQGDTYAYSRLAAPYGRVQLKTSTSLDVLSLFDSPAVRMDPNAVAVQLLTQSDTAAALSGKSKDGSKTWGNLVAFDEYRMTARRKYFFFNDGPPADSQTPAGSTPGTLAFDAQFLLDPEIATTAYVTDEAKKIAVVRWLAERFRSDVGSLAGRPAAATQTDQIVATAGLMLGQVFQGVLVELDRSSALAKNLSTEQGVEFPHISLGKGRIRLFVVSDVGTVAIRVNLPMPAAPAR